MLSAMVADGLATQGAQNISSYGINLVSKNISVWSQTRMADILQTTF